MDIQPSRKHYRASGYRTGAFSANRVYFSDGVGLGRGLVGFKDVFFGG